jgi:DNA-binding NarL/FixJ family response regulator
LRGKFASATGQPSQLVCAPPISSVPGRWPHETCGELTAQEAQFALLAHDGLSNPEIGARLLISPRTVQCHLRKLDIRSRSQLDGVLPRDAITVPPR